MAARRGAREGAAAAVTTALGLLVKAAGDNYGLTAHRPVPL